MNDHPAASRCPGPCNSAWRRSEALRETDGTEHHLTPFWGQPAQCGDCTERTRGYLEELPELLDAVLVESLEGTPAKSVGTIGRITVATWPGQASRLLVDRIVGEMAELQADILIQRRIWHPDRLPARSTAPREADHIRRIANSLITHWDWAMQNHPAASEPHTAGNANPGGQAASWHRSAQLFTRRDEQRDVKRLAPCPRCHGPYLVESRDLRLVDNRPYIECRDPDCRRILTQNEYAAHVKALNRAIKAAA